MIHTSPFTRTMQTAHHAAEAMGLPPNSIRVADELRERFFGEYDLTADTAYPIVWEKDTHDAAAPVPGAAAFTEGHVAIEASCSAVATSPCHRAGGGETVEDVAQRLLNLLRRLESSHKDSQILLVSHGDTLSIFAAVALGLDLRVNRRYGLDTGQLVQLSEVSQVAQSV